MANWPDVIKEQIGEVERELRLREKVYPRWIRDRKIEQHVADVQLLRMREVVESLKLLGSMNMMPFFAMSEGCKHRVVTGNVCCHPDNANEKCWFLRCPLLRKAKVPRTSGSNTPDVPDSSPRARGR